MSGEGVFTVGEPNSDKMTQIFVSGGMQATIPHRTKHRIEALSNLVFIEVQRGTCDEDDIIRYEDDFGRTDD